jgi:hypothetical protein
VTRCRDSAKSDSTYAVESTFRLWYDFRGGVAAITIRSVMQPTRYHGSVSERLKYDITSSQLISTTTQFRQANSRSRLLHEVLARIPTLKMKPSLILTIPEKPTTSSYSQKPVTCTPENLRDERYICKNPFFDSIDCDPIRLPCGHVIGHECFYEWIDRYPETCPYWNHLLPSVIERKADNWSASVLKLPLVGTWPGALEGIVIRYPFLIRERLELYTHSKFRYAEDREYMYMLLEISYIKTC